MKQKNKILILVASLIFILLASGVTSIPPLPTEFYGRVTSFNNPVIAGTEIKAYDNDNNLCGIFTVQNGGYYGTLTCAGKDDTGAGTGPTENEAIHFKIATNAATAFKGGTSELITPTYQTGSFKEIDLIAPPLVCGDNFCDIYENCGSCHSDCGSCPSGSGSSSGSGDSERSGDTSGGGTSSSGGGADTTGGEEIALSKEECKESWLCSDWGECLEDNTTTRECVDVNECGTEKSKPLLEDVCEYKEFEQINESTPLPPRVESPKQESPKIINICTERLGIFSFPSISFIVLFLFILAVFLGKLHRKLQKIRNDENLSDIKKLEQEYHLKKESYIFVITITVISIIVYFYHYFFFLCKTNYINHLWLLALFIVASPVMINFVIELMKYTEDKKLAKLVLLYDTHYQHFKNLLNITHSKIYIELKEMITYVDKIVDNTNFSELLKKNSAFRKVFVDINKLYVIYSNEKESFHKEKDLASNLNKLFNDEFVKSVIEKDPELRTVQDKMNLLYDTLNTKQGILDELTKIEEEYAQKVILDNINSKKR